MNPAVAVWQFVKRDPAWRMTLWLTPAFAVICALCHFFAPAETDGDPSIFLLAIFGLLFAGLAAVFTQSSDTDFQTTLPVTVRQVFLSRMLSMAAMMLLPVAAGVAIPTALKDPVPADLPREIWTLFTCTLLGIQCFAIRRNLPQWLIIILLPAWVFICAIAGIGDLFDGGSGFAVAARAVCWAIIAAVVLRTWQVLPGSFQDAPLNLSAATPPYGSSALVLPRSGASWKVLLPMLWPVSGWNSLVLFFVMLVAERSPFVYMLLAFQSLAIGTRIRWLLPLPVPPRTFLAAAMLPTLLALCGGYFVRIHLPWFPVHQERGISVRHSQDPAGLLQRRSGEDCGTPNVLPSLEYWIPIRSGRAPLIAAPWGETFQPATARVMGFDIYNPYAVGCDNTRRFLEWQFHRATVAVYGRPIALDKNVDPYVEQTTIPSPRTQLIGIAGLTGFSMLAMLIAMIFDWYRFRRLAEAIRSVSRWLVGAAAVALFLRLTLGDADILQWISWSLPDSPLAAIAVIVPVLALLYAAIETLFSQLELTDKPARGAA